MKKPVLFAAAALALTLAAGMPAQAGDDELCRDTGMLITIMNDTGDELASTPAVDGALNADLRDLAIELDNIADDFDDSYLAIKADQMAVAWEEEDRGAYLDALADYADVIEDMYREHC